MFGDVVVIGCWLVPAMLAMNWVVQPSGPVAISTEFVVWLLGR